MLVKLTPAMHLRISDDRKRNRIVKLPERRRDSSRKSFFRLRTGVPAHAQFSLQELCRVGHRGRLHELLLQSTHLFTMFDGISSNREKSFQKIETLCQQEQVIPRRHQEQVIP